MESLLNTLLWTGTLAGGLLVLLLLMSILGGIDIGGDVDADASSADGDAGTMPMGILKTLLTFISVSAFTARSVFLNTGWSWGLAALAALLAGAVAVLFLSWFFRWLLRNQESGNWYMWQTEGKMGTVHVPIPQNGKGRIHVKIDNNTREIVAKSRDGQAMATHDKVLVVEAKENIVIVVPLTD